jgi:hypothetical protein
MKQALAQLMLLAILAYGAWLWLSSPTIEPATPAVTTDPTWVDVAWQFSKVALSALPGLLVLAVGIAIISTPFLLWRHLRNKHEVEQLRAMRELPKGVTHLTQPRYTIHPPRFIPDAPQVPQIVDTTPALTCTLESANLPISCIPSTHALTASLSAHLLMARSIGAYRS